MVELSSNKTGGNGLQVSTENENLLSCAHALHKTLNLGISRCCFAEDGKEMYQNLKRTCTALFSSLSLFFIDVFVPRWRRVCVKSLMFVLGRDVVISFESLC